MSDLSSEGTGKNSRHWVFLVVLLAVLTLPVGTRLITMSVGHAVVPGHGDTAKAVSTSMKANTLRQPDLRLIAKGSAWAPLLRVEGKWLSAP